MIELKETTFGVLSIAEHILDEDQANPDPDMQGWFQSAALGSLRGSIGTSISAGYLQRKVIPNLERSNCPYIFYRISRKGIEALAKARRDQLMTMAQTPPEVWHKYLVHSAAGGAQ